MITLIVCLLPLNIRNAPQLNQHLSYTVLANTERYNLHEDRSYCTAVVLEQTFLHLHFIGFSEIYISKPKQI